MQHRVNSGSTAFSATRRVAHIIDWYFIVATVGVTALCFYLLLRNGYTPLGWVLVAVSVVPVYATIYEAALFTRALLRRRSVPETPLLDSVSLRAPGVAFLIASCEEPFEVARMTFDCAYTAPYVGPREIIVVDNSAAVDSVDYQRWKQYVESHAERDPDIRVVFRYNDDRAGLKPGNIDLGQSLIDSAEYVVFLDVDSSLPMHEDLLARAVNEFERDPQLGVLQFHTVATNAHFNEMTGAVAVIQNLLRIKLLLRASGGFAMFYGHNAMWRRSVLEINGPWLEHYRGNVMITEDLLKSVGVYARGYTSRYLDVRAGEWVPSSLEAMESMWTRWAYGGCQVFSKYARQIVTAKAIPTLVRIDLLMVLMSYAILPLFFPISLLWYLVFPAAQVGLMTFAMLVIPRLLAGWLIHRRYTGELSTSWRRKLWDLYAGLFLLDTFILAVSFRAVLKFVAGSGQGWRVTAKGLEERPSWWQVVRGRVYVIGLAVVLIVALFAGWGLHTGFTPTRLVDYLPLASVAVNLVVFIVVFGRQVRRPEASVEGTTIDGCDRRNTMLKKMPQFHGMNPLLQHQVAMSLEVRRFPSGAAIMHAGGLEMFFVADGNVQVGGDDGHEYTLGKGDLFGERSVVLDKSCSATVTAITDCEIYVLERAQLLRILRAQPAVERDVIARLESSAKPDMGVFA